MNINIFPFRTREFRVFLRPAFLLATFLALTLLLASSAFLEYRRSRTEVTRLLVHRGELLLRSISEASSRVLETSDEMESMLGERLTGELLLLGKMDRQARLRPRELRDMSTSLGFLSLTLVDRGGRVLATSAEEELEAELSEAMPHVIRSAALPEVDEVTIITPEDNLFAASHYLFITAGAPGRYLAGTLSYQTLTDIRKRLGIGSLMERLHTDDILFIALQDTIGIIAATANVQSIRRISADEFLRSTFEEGKTASRMSTFNGEETLEVSGPLKLAGRTLGLLRVGLSLETYRESVSRSKRRLLILTVILLVTGVIVINGLILFQNYDLTNRAYRHLKTYTGTILAEMKDGVIAIDGSGRITLVNEAACALFELDAGDCTGRKCSEVFPPPFNQFRELIPKGGRDGQWKGPVTAPDGREYSLRIGLSLIGMKGQPDDGLVALIEDVTEEEKIEQSLRQRERLKLLGELVAGVAHEVRNPLNAISIQVQRLGRRFRPDSEAEGFDGSISTIRSEIERLNGLLTRFLDFVKTAPARRSRVDLTRILEETLSLTGSSFERNGIRLINRIERSYPVMGDAALLKQVLLNLLLNAGDVTSRNGAVEIEGKTMGGEVYLSVLDEGPGIADDIRERIFDFFYTTKESGTGLGLSLAQGIVIDHGGRLLAEDRQDRRGARMTVVLPMEDEGDSSRG